ncbi:MAG TPA: HEPN domain-containing protein [Isosphaeraceae bacterium]|jgi:hypothetical protein|nr:HEPN domain-containing protein [Isosphaeraceae bacterium]
MTPAELGERSRSNLDRVRGLVALYERLAGPAAGRPSVQESDLLRSAVVLLHATLEDFLRSVATSRLHHAGAELLRTIPFVGGDGRKTTFTLGDLHAHRGRSVDDVIAESVDAHLRRSSYNNLVDVAGLLRDLGLDATPIRPHAARLAAMMARRHQIAHQLDRNEATGRGHHAARSISRAMLLEWIVAVDGMIRAILERL